MPSDPRAVLARLAPPPERTVAYGPGRAQVYDVRPPAPGGSPRAVTAVVVHGGFWRAAFDRAHAGSQAHSLAGDGFHVAVVEYRRTGMPGGGWPGTFEDARAALAAVRADPELPDPVVLVGHSAGGHLALWLLHQPEGTGVRGAVSLAGCLDLTMTAELGLDGGAATELVGGTPHQVPERYAQADPTRHGRARAPVRALHGTDDDRVPPAVSQSWWDRCGTARDRLQLLPGVEHFGLIDPQSSAFAAGLAAVRGLAGAGPGRERAAGQ